MSEHVVMVYVTSIYVLVVLTDVGFEVMDEISYPKENWVMYFLIHVLISQHISLEQQAPGGRDKSSIQHGCFI